MQEDKLSYSEKEKLGEEIFALVQKYFKNWGSGRPYGCVNYFKYDKLEYTFNICSARMLKTLKFLCNSK